MKKKFVPILAAGALIVVIICFMLLGSIIEKYTPSKEHMNLSDYYNLSGEQDVALILDNQIFFACYFVQLRIAKVKRIHSHGNTSTWYGRFGGCS